MSTKELSIIDDLQLWISEREGKIPIEVLYLPRPASDYKGLQTVFRVGVELIPYSWKLKLYKYRLIIKYTTLYGKIPEPIKEFIKRIETD